MASNVKKEDRASLNVSKETRDRFMTFLADLIGEKRKLLCQDDAVNMLLDEGEAKLTKEKNEK